MTIANIRHTLDTTDKFWETENEWLEEQSPRVSAVMLSLVKVLLNKKWDKALREDYGDEFIEALNRRRSSFSPKIIRLTQKESKLCSRVCLSERWHMRKVRASRARIVDNVNRG